MRQQGSSIPYQAEAGLESWAYVARSTRVESHNRSAVAYQRTEAG